MVTSNEDWIVPIDLSGDRRWAIYDVTDEVAYGRDGAQEYWRPIVAALEDGSGPACLLDYLLRYDYDPALLKRPPMTKAKADQARHSADPLDTWWFDVLCGEATVTGRPEGDLFGREIEKGTVYASYLRWHSETHIRARVAAQAQFWKRLRKLTGSDLIVGRPSSPDGTRTRVVTFPDRTVCQTRFAKAAGCAWEDFDAS